MSNNINKQIKEINDILVKTQIEVNKISVKLNNFEKEIDKVDELLKLINNQFQSLNVKIENYEKNNEKINKTLFGNGSEGLKTKVSNFESMMNSLSKTVDDLNKIILGDEYVPGLKEKVSNLFMRISIYSTIGGFLAAFLMDFLFNKK